MIDIHGGSKDPRSARLSNFADRPFMFEGVACAGIEGILQALKEPNVAEQADICALSGKAAKKAGSELNNWKEGQTLWWKGNAYQRGSRAYLVLITCIYNTVYEQDSTFKQDLLAIEMEDICHSIGNPDQRDTVLTEAEMIHQLNRLRVRAWREQKQVLVNLPDGTAPGYRGIKEDGDPVVFLKKHYATMLSQGLLNQLNLRRMDEKLLNAIKYKMRKDGGKLTDVVPPGINR